MATSGDITYVVTRDDIIKEAMEQIGVLGEGDSPNAAQLTSASTTLNNMVKSWQSRGIQLFTYQKLFLVPQKDQHIYELYGSTGDYFTTDLGLTTTTAALATSDTVVAVTDSTGAAGSDVVLVELDTGFWHADTIASVDSSIQITLTTGVASACASGAKVYWMDPTRANRPMNLNLAYRRTYGTDGTDGTDIPVEMISRLDYFDQSNKNTEGQINQAFYDPQFANPTTPKLYIWPSPSDVTEYLVMWGQRSVDTFLAATDDADFPQQWYEALSFGLAVRLCPKYGASDKTFQRVSMLAETALFDSESGDTEDGFYVQPDERWY